MPKSPKLAKEQLIFCQSVQKTGKKGLIFFDNYGSGMSVEFVKLRIFYKINASPNVYDYIIGTKF